MKVAAITVTYRGGDTPSRWAQAIERAAARVDRQTFILRAIAVDNASGDGTAERLRRAAPWVEIVEMPHNLGFAAGCNAGIELAADADVIALINPDVAVREDFFERLAKLQWPDELGARGPLVLSCSGGVEQSARGFPGARTALFGRTSLLSRIFSGSQAARRELRADPSAGAVKVDWVSGATLIAPRSRFETVGPLDAGYFMYWEDADWCRRAHDAGMRIEYEPTLVVEHLQGSSSRSHRLATTVAFHRSAFRYWRMHVARNPVSLGAAAVALTLRCALKLSALAASSVLDRRRGTSATPARRRS